MANFLDLFAGAGGLSEGFIGAGFLPVAYIEMDKAACFTLRTRAAYHLLKSTGKLDLYYAYLKGDITRNELYKLIPAVELDKVINLQIGKANNQKIFNLVAQSLKKSSLDLLIGGPPCQAYSLVGRARSKNSMAKDPRNFLFIDFARYIQQFRPKMFVFENVLGLRSAQKGEYYRRMLMTFKNINGYQVQEYELSASHFGVLQSRKRIILIGCRKDVNISFPKFQANTNSYVVADILNDLPRLQAGEGRDKTLPYFAIGSEYVEFTGIRNGESILTQHICRPNSNQDKEIYRIAVQKWNEKKERLDYNDLPEHLKTHLNRTSFGDRFKVVAANLNTAQTITAHISKDGNYYIHPDIVQNRSLSVREAARLQSFPDDFYFEGETERANRTAAFKQIGNAVPPLMAKCIAEEIKKILNLS